MISQNFLCMQTYGTPPIGVVGSNRGNFEGIHDSHLLLKSTLITTTLSIPLALIKRKRSLQNMSRRFPSQNDKWFPHVGSRYDNALVCPSGGSNEGWAHTHNWALIKLSKGTSHTLPRIRGLNNRAWMTEKVKDKERNPCSTGEMPSACNWFFRAALN